MPGPSYRTYALTLACQVELEVNLANNLVGIEIDGAIDLGKSNRELVFEGREAVP
jgi:hypothetical protein